VAAAGGSIQHCSTDIWVSPQQIGARSFD